MRPKGRSPGAFGGVKPKRKRGVHRARKRGELWVQIDDMMRKLNAELTATVFGIFKDEK